MTLQALLRFGFLPPNPLPIAAFPLLSANTIAILCCSIVNFCLGNHWAFAAS